jgi:hypothetical protein
MSTTVAEGRFLAAHIETVCRLIYYLPADVVTENRVVLGDSLAQQLARVQALEALYYRECQVKYLEESLHLCTTMLDSTGGLLIAVIFVVYR